MDEIIRDPNNEYTLGCRNGKLTRKPKKQYMRLDALSTEQFSYSKIEEFVIKKADKIIPIKSRNWRDGIIGTLVLSDALQIREKSTWKYGGRDECGKKGYKWCGDIHMSFADRNAKLTLKEIIHMVEVMNATFEMSVKLGTGEIVHFKSAPQV
jgi:hypothetical protein